MRSAVRCCAVAALSLCSQLFCGTAFAQVPSIASTSPQAVKPGETIDVTLRGGNLAGASDLWTSFSATAVLSPDVQDNGKIAAEVVYRLNVPDDVSAGVYGIRVAASGGVSPLKLFTVDDLDSVPQQGNNHSPAEAQLLTLPCAVDGVVPALTRQYFKFQVEAGQRISFEVLARRIGSPLDPMIRLLDAAGSELTYSDDEPGLSGDSQLSFNFETAGEYMIEVSDIRYQGGGNYAYRLRLGDFPCITTPYPMGARRGSQLSLTFAGTDVEGVEPFQFSSPSDPLLDAVAVAARRSNGQSSGMAMLVLSDTDEFLETEPNDDDEQPNRVALGASLNGRLDKPGDVDRFVFPAKSGQTFQFNARTRSLGSPADVMLTLLKSDGGKVAEVDDTGLTDAVLDYKFPADGDYTLLVEDLHGHGGQQFVYRIITQESRPGFKLAASADTLNIGAGGTAAITVNAQRTGYNGPIKIDVLDLPEKVTVVPTVIGPGRNSVVLTVRSAADASAGKVLPVRIVGTARIGDADVESTASVTAAVMPQFSGMPWPPASLAEATAIGIGPKPQFVLRTEPQTLVFGKHLKATVKVIAQRQEGFNEPIALAVTPEKDGLAAEVSAALKPIEQDKNEVEIVFSAGEKSPLGEFTGVLVGTLKKEKTTISQSAPGIALRLEEPFRLTAEPADARLARNGQLKVKVTAARNPAFSGPILLKFENLPTGVAAAEATLPADGDTLEIVLSADEDAQTGAVNNIMVAGEATVDKAKLTAKSSAVTFAVE